MSLTPIIRQYSAARAIFFIYMVKTHGIHSIQILKQLPEGKKNKSVGPDRVSGEIIKLGGEALIPCLA